MGRMTVNISGSLTEARAIVRNQHRNVPCFPARFKEACQKRLIMRQHKAEFRASGLTGTSTELDHE
jgi:hypothetical protein